MLDFLTCDRCNCLIDLPFHLQTSTIVCSICFVSSPEDRKKIMGPKGILSAGISYILCSGRMNNIDKEKYMTVKKMRVGFSTCLLTSFFWLFSKKYIDERLVLTQDTQLTLRPNLPFPLEFSKWKWKPNFVHFFSSFLRLFPHEFDSEVP